VSRKVAGMIAALGLVLVPLSAGAGLVRASTPASTPNLRLYHDGWSTAYRSPFGAVATGSKLVLRLRTAPSVSKTWLYLVPPAGSSTRESMSRKSKTAAGAVWSVTVTASSKPGVWGYYFGAQAGKATAWYGDAGAIAGSGPGQTYQRQGNVHPYELTVYLSTFRTPSWMRNAVIYQIFPDRFYDGNKANDSYVKTGTVRGYITDYFHKNWSDTPQDGPPYSSDFFGGDLQGVIDKLPYIHKLGVNVIYLNPIFLAPSDHKYDTSNYFEIDPEFGPMATFKTLVSDAAKLHMHIILDGVFNHTGSDSVYFNQYGAFKDVGAYQSRSSKYYPWYTFYSWPDNYNSFFGVSTLPTLTEIPAVENFIFRKPRSVAQYWLKQGASGWRLDYVPGKSHSWWQAFRKSVKAADPKSALIAEIYGTQSGALYDPVSWLLGNQLDGATNYRFRDGVLNFFAGGKGASEPSRLNATQFMTTEMGLLSEYPRPAVMSSMNLIDSHDTERILNDLNFNKQALRLVALYQMTWLGAPTVFYGDETGITGADNNVGRATFPWSHQDTSLEAYYTRLIHMRLLHPALTAGTVTPLLSTNNQRLVAYLRESGSEKVIVLLNDSGNTETADIPVPQLQNGTVLAGISPGSDGKVTVAKGKAHVTLGKLSGEVLLATKQA
jgi:cyclomaltodextrinase / maltogenic alpha-amylase / neopullulanase